MRWTWDHAKDRRNRAKHGLPLSVGEIGLADPLAMHIPDPHPDGDRWNSICTAWEKTIVVVHTWPDGEDEKIAGRIISVRLATSHERRRYEDGG